MSYTAPPGNMKVVSVGRIDPLKDVQTMLRVAVEVSRRVPGVKFEYWGPPTKGQETYARACEELGRRLGRRGLLRVHGHDERPQRRGARRGHSADDEHLRGPADVDPRGDVPGAPGGGYGRRRRAGGTARVRHRAAARRRARDRHGRLDTAAKPPAGQAPRRARLCACAPPVHAHGLRGGISPAARASSRARRSRHERLRLMDTAMRPG